VLTCPIKDRNICLNNKEMMHKERERERLELHSG